MSLSCQLIGLRMFCRGRAGLRTSLHFTLQDAANRIVMISGPTQDCGKTLVSTSLAAIEAQAGLRVLFIDADMREGYVHNIFDLKTIPGFPTCLTENVISGGDSAL